MDIEISYLIPTLKKQEEVEALIFSIKQNSLLDNIEIFASCTQASASINRNLCLNNATGKYIIMMDDDICGLYKGWGENLTKHLENEMIIIASPRLLKPNGSYALMMGDPFIYEGVVQTKENRVCTACFCFRRCEVRFDENYIGSGFEDDDFMIQMNMKYPGKGIVIDNNIQVIHINEMKNQKGIYWEKNKQYFLDKWKNEIDRWHK